MCNDSYDCWHDDLHCKVQCGAATLWQRQITFRLRNDFHLQCVFRSASLFHYPSCTSTIMRYSSIYPSKCTLLYYKSKFLFETESLLAYNIKGVEQRTIIVSQSVNIASQWENTMCFNVTKRVHCMIYVIYISCAIHFALKLYVIRFE